MNCLEQTVCQGVFKNMLFKIGQLYYVGQISGA